LLALEHRLRSKTKPGHRDATDRMKIGLAVEGGGMKGVVSAGACGELLRLGMYDCFDAVYGSSAGAMNLTYYLAKQPEGVLAYEEDLVDGAFFDIKRLPKTNKTRRLMGTRKGRRPAMDVSYLVDEVMEGRTGKKLNWDGVLSSPVQFNVVATSLDTLTPVILSSPFKDVKDLKKCLKASAAVPLFAGPRPVVHRGQRMVDAAVMEPVPVTAAAFDECTHVLVLLTRVLSEDSGSVREWSPDASASSVEGSVDETVSDNRGKTSEKKKNFFSGAFGPLVYKIIRGALMSPRHMRDAWLTHDGMRKLIADGVGVALDEALLKALRDFGSPSDFPNRPHVFSVSPDPKSLPKNGVSSICMDSAILKRGNQAGKQAVFRALGHLERL
jgi:predicted patatin/cPLA2 family phospholipase